MTTRWPRFSFYGVLLLVLAADQLTKAWATASLEPLGSVVLVPGLFNLTYECNPGIAFGMFPHQGLIVTGVVAVLAIVALYSTRGLNWAVLEPNLVGGGLCGGAVGNLLDRSRLGYVVDFLDVHLGSAHWPIFNVADSMICISVGWIVWRQLQSKS